MDERARLRKVAQRKKKLVRSQWALNPGPPRARQVRNVHDHPDRPGKRDEKRDPNPSYELGITPTWRQKWYKKATKSAQNSDVLQVGDKRGIK